MIHAVMVYIIVYFDHLSYYIMISTGTVHYTFNFLRFFNALLIMLEQISSLLSSLQSLPPQMEINSVMHALHYSLQYQKIKEPMRCMPSYNM